ncbi:hypothetical protein [Palleronia sp. LCG004]|uniref:hypothetical protein n=1 Tax=Palleronia sp. LCG004 TaxID=3079304 RepID=UPI0029431E5E|nr:hypothetical protein [Palleronia sp. LCG004]WOI55529.1 hypothetical protein RVY76_10800 [Palleronia sp. LCG004]
MIARLLHRLSLTLAALLLVAAGVVAIAQVAPDRDVLARAASAASLGSADLCLTSEDGATHRCPFCNLLPDPPRMRSGELRVTVLPQGVVRITGDLVAGPLSRPDGTHARAPPIRA